MLGKEYNIVVVTNSRSAFSELVNLPKLYYSNLDVYHCTNIQPAVREIIGKTWAGILLEIAFAYLCYGMI